MDDQNSYVLMWTTTDTLAALMFALHALLPMVTVFITLTGLDDLFVDLVFIRRWFWRRLIIGKYFVAKTAADLVETTPNLPIAVMIPAWREADVIGSMLQSTLAIWHNEKNIRLFVGWYCNDLPTGRAIAAVAADDKRVVPVVVPHDGPTTKADCLNTLWRAIGIWEGDNNAQFPIFLLHDAEDLVAVDEPAVIRHVIGIRGKAMVQTPVIAIPVPGSRFISGHYLDEFSEAHTKDLAVREAMGAWLPSAGVGCAFAREALKFAEHDQGGLPFAAASVTEDYELSMRLGRSGFSSAFVRLAISPEHGPVATAEHFPDTIKTAVKQKSRWLLGIALQGWSTLGWHGTLAQRYWLLRDRKALFTAYLNMLAYILVFSFTVLWTWQYLSLTAPHFPITASSNGFLANLLRINGGLLIWRLLMRALCVWRTAGRVQAILSLPRAVLANLINFLAAWRALRLFIKHKRSGKAVAWDKTQHRFPVLQTI